MTWLLVTIFLICIILVHVPTEVDALAIMYFWPTLGIYPMAVLSSVGTVCVALLEPICLETNFRLCDAITTTNGPLLPGAILSSELISPPCCSHQSASPVPSMAICSDRCKHSRESLQDHVTTASN